MIEQQIAAAVGKNHPLDVYADEVIAEIVRLRAEVERLRAALKDEVELAQEWFDSINRKAMSESDYRMWLATSWRSNRHQRALRALRGEGEG